MLKTGGKAKLNVPHPLPRPYDTMIPAWVNFITGADGKEVILTLKETVTTSIGAIDGWKIHVDKPSFTRSWAPTAWLDPIEPMPLAASPLSKVPCNCPWNSILQSGCKNPQHE